MQEAANGRRLAHFPFYNPRLSGAAHGGGGGLQVPTRPAPTFSKHVHELDQY